MSGNLGQVAEVDIDPKGVFKYILMKVFAKGTAGKEATKMIVRGYQECGFHADIFDKVEVNLKKLKLEAECVGGGRIKHDPEEKTLKVYGYSQGYGKADHEVSVAILRKQYAGYDISWSDDGY